MLARIGRALFLAIVGALVTAGNPAGAAPEASWTPWLYVDWGGGEFNPSEPVLWSGEVPPPDWRGLVVDASGTVRLWGGGPTLGSPVGLFELRLPRARMEQLREAVERPDFLSLPHVCGSPEGHAQWAHIGLVTREGRKDVTAYADYPGSPDYPAAMKRLLNVQEPVVRPEAALSHPGGLLGDLAFETTGHPEAAVVLRANIEDQSRIGKSVVARLEFIVRNVGHRPVALPSAATRHLAGGAVRAWIQVEKAGGPVRVGRLKELTLGAASSASSYSALDDRTRPDVDTFVVLKPGEERRLELDCTVAAVTDEPCEVAASWEVWLHAPRDLLEGALHAFPVAGGSLVRAELLEADGREE